MRKDHHVFANGFVRLRYASPGFSVLEFVISIMISAMIMTASLTIYNQISKAAAKVQTVTSQEMAIIIIKKRLSADLEGLCPIWFTADDLKKKPAEYGSAKGEAAQPEIKPDNPGVQKNSYFYGQNIDKQLDYFTFVTTSTLQTYGSTQHRCARVVYMLKAQQEDPKLFMLQRKEEYKISNEFNKESVKQGNFYTLAKNIALCEVQYGFIETSPEERQKNPETPWKMKWVDHWGASKDMKQSNQYETTLPDIIRMKITLRQKSSSESGQRQLDFVIVQSKEAKFVSFAEQRRMAQRNGQSRDGQQPDGGSAGSGGSTVDGGAPGGDAGGTT